MDYTQTLLVLLVVVLCSSRGMTQTPSEVAPFQTPTYTSTENVLTSTPSGNVSAQQKIMDEFNQKVLGLTNTVMRLDEINTRMMVRLDEMKNETLNQMKETDSTIFKRLDEMDTHIMKNLNETDIRIKALEISATNSSSNKLSEVNRNNTLLLSQAMRTFMKRLDGIESRLQRQEVSSNRKEKQFVLFTDEKKSWTEAYNDCIKRNMSLASIESEEESNKVVSLFKKLDRSSSSFWLSGTDLGHTGRWVWKSTGLDVTYNQWRQGQPDNYVWSGEVSHCMFADMFADRGNMRWGDYKCSAPQYYICQHWVSVQ